MIDFLIDTDTQLFLFFNSLHTPLLDRFMMFFTGRFVWVPMYAAILYILFHSYRPRHAMVLTLAVVMSIVLADQVCATLLRPVFERLRPAHPDNPISPLVHIVDGYRGGRYGFPSCHGANSFALATILSLIVRNRRFSRFIFGWALVNSYTRLYLGVHYPGDLLTGALTGSLGAWCVYRVAQLAVPLRAIPDSMPVVFSVQSHSLATAMGLEAVNVRVFDILTAVGTTTCLVLLVASC